LLHGEHDEILPIERAALASFNAKYVGQYVLPHGRPSWGRAARGIPAFGVCESAVVRAVRGAVAEQRIALFRAIIRFVIGSG